MKYDVILADLDDTLFDFTASARASLREVLEHFGFPVTEACIQDYLRINQSLWEQFERGEIQKSTIYPTRYRQLFQLYGLDADPVEANAYYKDRLWRHRCFKPGCEELLKILKPHCEICIVTNGTTETQHLRINDSGLAHYFDHVFISEEMGCRKPEVRFYDLIFQAIGEDKRSHAIILGDSLSSDMQGGRNAGLPTCFYGNPADADSRCDFVIKNLLDFPTIIGLDA